MRDWWLAAEAHFVWGSVMYGYLLYDTAFTLAFYSAVGSPSAPPAQAGAPLGHVEPATRSVGLQVSCCTLAWTSCALRLYGQRMALLPMPERLLCCRV